MSNTVLDRIKRGTGTNVFRVLCASPEGLGKTTFASNSPSPLFIAAEDGLTGFDHLPRLVPDSTEDIHFLIDSLMVNPGAFKSVVIDTTDWLERLIAQSICKRDSKQSIEDYGYGKGFTMVQEELVKLLQKLDSLRYKHGIWIVMLAHVHIKPFNDPGGQSWDRYEMKGHKAFAGILREWSDVVLFATRQVFKTKKAGDKVDKAIGGERVMHTEWSPAWDAKNRLNLPSELPMDWADFVKAIEANSPTVLCERIRELHKTATIAEPAKASWNKALQSLGGMTADKLKSAIEKLEAMQPAK